MFSRDKNTARVMLPYMQVVTIQCISGLNPHSIHAALYVTEM